MSSIVHFAEAPEQTEEEGEPSGPDYAGDGEQYEDNNLGEYGEDNPVRSFRAFVTSSSICIHS